VYIAPPGHHVLITGQCTLALGRGDLVQFVRPSADVLFKSAAKQYGRRLIAVVLTGTGKDGSAGIKAVKEMGGFTIAQQQSNAEYSGMPRSAIDTGAVDLVLPLEKIAVNIQALIRSGEKYDH
jgi:two-component system chemotaxis response regulator CheB